MSSQSQAGEGWAMIQDCLRPHKLEVAMHLERPPTPDSEGTFQLLALLGAGADPQPDTPAHFQPVEWQEETCECAKAIN
jgi:hypothetical protein